MLDSRGIGFERIPEPEADPAGSGAHLRQMRPHLAELRTGTVDGFLVAVYVEGHSPFGVFDMAGHVEEVGEYVAGSYRPYLGATRVHDDLTDLHGEAYRIARGGSFARHGDLARCSRRHGWYPSDHDAVGLRVAEAI